MIITISGTPGAGKSSIAKILEKELGGERLYAGELMRKKAKEQHMTLQQLTKLAETNQKIDQDLDREIFTLAQSRDAPDKIIIVEGRIQFHFLPKSLKILITVSSKVGAHRIYNDLQDPTKNKERNEGSTKSLEEVTIETEKRQQADANRYKNLYHIDYTDPQHYDLIIDTTSITIREAADQIIEYIKQ